MLKITVDSNSTDPADTLGEGDLNPQTPTTEEFSWAVVFFEDFEFLCILFLNMV